LLCQTLGLRRAREAVFTRGAYLPLDATGFRRDHVCAFARWLEEAGVVVVVPRLVVQLADESERPPMGPEVWGQTHLLLPAHLASRCYQNVFTGEVLTPDSYRGTPGPLVGAVLGRFPVALLRLLEKDEGQQDGSALGIGTREKEDCVRRHKSSE
jgi:(1->4)-alpha-D-glucan 1-alpha-D-glucosylmutase